MGVQNVGLRTRGGVRCLLLIVNDEGMDYGGRPDIGRILERWGTDGRWGGGGEGQWFHTIAAAKFILRAKTLEIVYAQTRRYNQVPIVTGLYNRGLIITYNRVDCVPIRT